MRLAVVLVLAACGGKPAAPAPKPQPAKELAKLLDLDLYLLGEIAHRQRGNCERTIAELEPHVERMRSHKLEVNRMLEDAQQAKELKAELAAYASRAAGKSDAIAQDLGATYLACGKTCTATCDPAPGGGANNCVTRGCKQAYQLERMISNMPTY